MNDAIDPAMTAVLTQLWRAKREAPERAWSLAKLAKQADLPMSTLKRQLTSLSEGGWCRRRRARTARAARD